ncbi:hypothetical protein DRW41_15720 [Neobacillus piezotolerans]|uniref:Uncharacterized protein n=1 Tax=Neobacillus piezotolerans TaxID=2259171 RepID=A0A3D8GNG6_9BACI|nr:hypothetical protein DRW41_15720 [Neobacillus piezotolerans]
MDFHRACSCLKLGIYLKRLAAKVPAASLFVPQIKNGKNGPNARIPKNRNPKSPNGPKNEKSLLSCTDSVRMPLWCIFGMMRYIFSLL